MIKRAVIGELLSAAGSAAAENTDRRLKVSKRLGHAHVFGNHICIIVILQCQTNASRSVQEFGRLTGIATFAISDLPRNRAELNSRRSPSSFSIAISQYISFSAQG
jgi:hypothetical protein